MKPVQSGLALCAGLLLCADGRAEVPMSGLGTGVNPTLSLILDFRYTDLEKDPNQYRLPGFQLPEGASPGDKGGAFHEGEFVALGTIGDHLYAALTATVGQYESADVEEGYLETMGLGRGLTVRGGRFYSGLGYLNSQHVHVWDFADAPLIYRGLFGDQLSNDGVQLRWVAPTDLFLTVGAELGTGKSWPAFGDSAHPSHTLFTKVGGDVGESHSWQLGLARWWGTARDRQALGTDQGLPDDQVATFSGDTAVSAVDFIWKWAPEGNPFERNFKFQAEYLRRDEKGTLGVLGAARDSGGSYSGNQAGWYAQAVYQFRPEWRVGARYDRLSADNSGSDPAFMSQTGLVTSGHVPQRTSVMVDWTHTEYSRLRLQYNRDDSYGSGENQVILQYVLGIGAHGAHTF